ELVGETRADVVMLARAVELARRERDVAENPLCPRRPPALAVSLGQVERPLGVRGGPGRVAGGQPGLGQCREQERLAAQEGDGRRLCDGLLEKALAFTRTTGEHVHGAERGGEAREP